MSNMLRWGILSTARINRAFVGGVGESGGSCIQAVASREWTRANEWAKEHGVPRAFGSYEELLESGEVDAIYNPLPNSMHFEWTVKALEAGLPVLCEKPFMSNAAEAREVAAVSARTGKPVAEAFMYRFHPIYDQILETIAAGVIGDVVAIRAAQCFFLRDRSDIRASAALAGGATMDVGCYCINFCRRIAGCEPTRAFAMERRSTVDDTLMGSLEFPNGILAQFEVSMETNRYSRAEIAGTRGMLILPQPFFPGRDDTEFILRCGDNEEHFGVPGVDCYRLEAEDFAQAVREGRQPRWPVEDAIRNMAVIDAIYESARTGAAVPVEA
jgi:xylose dehydrogenase (NAD/NADP)